MAEFDYTSSMSPIELEKQTLSKEEFIKSCVGINNKKMYRLLADVSDTAQFNRETLRRANEVFNYLKDNGYQYDVIARGDGRGLLANIKGIGGSTLQVTAASADGKGRNGQTYSGANHVGNLFTNGRAYSAESRNNSNIGQTGAIAMSNPIVMVEAMAGNGDYRVVMESPKTETSKKDRFYQVYDKNGEKVGTFSRQSKRLTEREQQDLILDGDDELLFDLNDNQTQLSPLQQLVVDANREMAMLRDEENKIIRNSGGITETLENMTDIEITDQQTLAGLDLDKLRDFFDRRTIADAIAKETEMNPNFDLRSDAILPAYNPNDPEANGLKDLLAEELAGVNAKRVTPKELAATGRNPEELEQKYQKLLDDVGEHLDQMNVQDVDYYFDEDHVIHWSGAQNGEEISGQIGQVFLPDENVIDTAFKTVTENSNRNYHMVPGYRAYYVNRDYETIEPEVDDEGYVLRTDGTRYTMKGETFKADDLQGDALYSAMKGIDKYNNSKNARKQYAQIATKAHYKTIPVVNTVFDPEHNRNVIADVNGDPFKFNNAVIPLDDPSQFPPERIRNMQAYIESQKKKGFDVQEPGITEREPTLRDALRLRGYEQSLDTQVHALLQKQILQSEIGSRNNTGLNGIYHGDVYASRIAEEKLNDKRIIDTLASRVRFENEVMQMTADEIDAPVMYDKTGDVARDNNGNVIRDRFTTHRHNLRAFEDIFDRRLSSDGQALGLVRYLNDGVKVSKDGVPLPVNTNGLAHASIYDQMPFWYADPSDRSMMAANQVLKSKSIKKSNVLLTPYKGFTFEDSAVVSKAYAEENELFIGDKISDNHGNKATIGRIASPETDPFFKENPNIEVIMNPFSISSRSNTGVVLEMKHNGYVEKPTLNGQPLPDNTEVGQLEIIKTNISAESKTHVYNGDSPRKGRSFGVQEAWVAQGLDLDGVLNEVYGQNQKSFEQLREYLNVTGIDIDDEGVLYSLDKDARIRDLKSAQYNNEELKRINPSVDYDPETGIKLPEEGGLISLPISVEMPTGHRVQDLYLLSEENRKTQEMFDGSLMRHDYSKAYADIIKSGHELDTLIHKSFDDLYENTEDISKIDFADPEQREAALNRIEDPKTRDIVDRQLKSSMNVINGRVNQLTTRVVNDRLGGQVAEQVVKDKNGDIQYDEKGEPIVKKYSDSELIKRSIVKKDIMGKQVPHSATSIVTADPTVDLNKIKVSPDIYDKMALENPKDDKVLLWRDPALHDGSMRAFSIEKDENITGVAINPLVTQSFGMDFDGDTVGLYAPKTKEAQQDLREKAAVEKHLINRVTHEFDGNVSMDFVTGPIAAGYVGEQIKNDKGELTDDIKEIKQGPLKGREEELKGMSPKKQVEFMMTELAQKEDGWKEVNQIWMDTVVADTNIGTASVAFSTREKFRDSLMYHAETGAKGKPKAIQSDASRFFDKEEQRIGQRIRYGQRLNYRDSQNPKKISEQSLDLREQETTVMDYYDRGEHIHELYGTLKNKGVDKETQKRAVKQLQYYMTPEHSAIDRQGNEIYDNVGLDKNGKQKLEKRMVPNYGSLALDENNTRKAQGGKTDLTGQAGSKSQKAVGAMYDTDYMLSAMSVTEPLTQATLKLKKDPKMTPYISSMLIDYNRMLDKGGLTNEEYKDAMHELYDGDKYDNLGLQLNDDDLDKMHAVLSENNEFGRTDRIDAVIERKASPLMKANLYGYSAIKDLSNENTQNIDGRALDISHKKEHAPLHSLRDGKNASKHVPEDLTSISKSNVDKSIKGFHERATLAFEKAQRERTVEFKERPESTRQIDDKAYSRQVEMDNANEQSLKQRAQYDRDAAEYEQKTGQTAPEYDSYDANDRSQDRGTYDRAPSKGKKEKEGFELEM